MNSLRYHNKSVKDYCIINNSIDNKTAKNTTIPLEKTSSKAAKDFRTALVIPTLNAGSQFQTFLASLQKQTLIPQRLLLVDSSSTDNTVKFARNAGFEIHVTKREDFSHGTTRQNCVNLLTDNEIILFLTQDAVLVSHQAIENLVSWFSDPDIGAAYGRQLPRLEANPIEAHARLFNYPHKSEVKTYADVPRLGIKTVFISDSFVAYRRKALMKVGGFPSNAILSEDTYVASKMILAGWKIVYSSEATVYHSHHLSYKDEFQRYFDIGVFHAHEPWIRQSFGKAEGEGVRYVKSEIKYLKINKPSLIPSAFLRTGLKLVGYKLGNLEKRIPCWIKTQLSLNKRFWQ